MSACNCCELFPLEFDLEFRGSGFSSIKCGFTNRDIEPESCYDGSGVFLTITTTWEPGEDDDRGTYVVTETYAWNSETKTCDYTRNPATDEPPYDDVEGSMTPSYALSNEYASESLMDNVYNAIEPITGEWSIAGGVNPATLRRELIDKVGEDCYVESLYNESLLEVRISHPPTATGYLKVWLVTRTQTFDQETETYSTAVDAAFQEYEWTGEPADMTIGMNEEGNRIDGETYVLPRPDAQTKVTVEVFKFSFLPGYEPADPVVDEETAPDIYNPTLYALVRPTPDCLSNGVPTLSYECPPTP
jgi:hypothetical protein